MWKLWIDDQAFDPDTPPRHCPEGFTPAVSSTQAIELTTKLGMPEFIDFDHDLGLDANGNTDDAMRYVRWLYANIPGKCPDYRIHSANPDGQKNIMSFMDSWKRSEDDE